MSLDEDMERGRRAVAEVRREIWPAHNGAWPEEATPEEVNRYIEALEAKVAGTTMALNFAGSLVVRP